MSKQIIIIIIVTWTSGRKDSGGGSCAGDFFTGHGVNKKRLGKATDRIEKSRGFY
jgi:hypothetical protein